MTYFFQLLLENNLINRFYANVNSFFTFHASEMIVYDIQINYFNNIPKYLIYSIVLYKSDLDKYCSVPMSGATSIVKWHVRQLAQL